MIGPDAYAVERKSVTGDITKIHTNITRAEFESWRKQAINIIDVLSTTSHTEDTDLIPVYYLNLRNYHYLPLRLFVNQRSSKNYTGHFSDWVHLRGERLDNESSYRMQIGQARLFVDSFESILPVVFSDEVKQSEFSNPGKGSAVQPLSVNSFSQYISIRNGQRCTDITAITKIDVLSINTNSTYLHHRICVSFLINELEENNSFRMEILPPYIKLSYDRTFPPNFIVDSVYAKQQIKDFLLHCHYQPYLIQFSENGERNSQ